LEKTNSTQTIKGILIDAYREGNSIALWIKTENKDVKVLFSYSTLIYIKKCHRALNFLENKIIPYSDEIMKDAFGKLTKVLAVKVPNLSQYERFVSWIEKENDYKLTLYNADLKPEETFLFYNNINPFSIICIQNGRIISKNKEEAGFAVPLRIMRLHIEADSDIYNNDGATITRIISEIGEGTKKVIKGDENNILLEFTNYFESYDPDMIISDYAFSKIPFLYKRLESNNIKCKLHRFGSSSIRFRGSKSFYTYGSVIYKEFGITLKGRLLIDGKSFSGSEVETESLIELCRLSGIPFSRLGSKSFGSIFQGSLVRKLLYEDALVPFKEKTVDNPMSLYELLKADRSGISLDPIVGFHTNVAEIDFSSMYPWLIYNNNISAEMIKKESKRREGNLEGSTIREISAPGIPVSASIERKGYVPRTILPYLEKRMYYKKNPTALNRQKALGLKWVLVTSYGYLRFREFKLGMASSHMAIGAFARDLLLKTMRFCEDRDYEVVHGIVDALYIKKNNIKDDDVRQLCSDIEAMSGVPISFEGIFQWIVFMPSINDSKRPVPTKYYGVFRNGDIKVRGILMRQKSTPAIVKYFQGKIIESMKDSKSPEDVIAMKHSYYSFLREAIKSLNSADSKWLERKVRIGKEEYKNNVLQKMAISQMKRNNSRIMPGQSVNVINITKKGSGKKHNIVISEFYNPKEHSIDLKFYSNLLARSLFELLQPLGITEAEVIENSKNEMQAKISEYNKNSMPADNDVLLTWKLSKSP